MNQYHLIWHIYYSHQPLDLTTNAATKKLEKRAFSEYFTEHVITEVLNDPHKDVITIQMDLKLSTLKPKHGKVMCKLYDYLKEKISSWRDGEQQGFRTPLRKVVQVNYQILILMSDGYYRRYVVFNGRFFYYIYMQNWFVQIYPKGKGVGCFLL